MSGVRVSNTWIIYLQVGDNFPKGELIPHNIFMGYPEEIKVGDRKTSRQKRSPRPIS